jgi:S-layer protein
VTIAIDGGVKGSPNITRNQTGQAAVTITSTGAANAIGNIDLDTGTTIKSVTIDAATKLTATLVAADYASGATLTLKGAGFIDLSGAALSPNITTVNAAASTGGVSVIMGTNTATFTGGAGDDTVNAGALVFNSTGSLNGGGGTNTLVLQDQGQLTAATAAKMTNFQVLRLNDDDDNALDTFNVSLMPGLTGLIIGAQSANDGVNVTNMSAALAANVTIAGGQVVGPTFGIIGATNVGQLDTLSLKIDDGLTAQNTLTVAGITAAGVETIKIATVDNLTLQSATGLTAMTKMEFSGSGNVNVTTGALALNVNTIIDASALTGTFTFDASAATTNGLAIIGSSTKANTITGTAQDDIITGGTGVDKVIYTSGNTNGDTVDFVSDSAADEIEFGANMTLTSKTVTITNFDPATPTTTEDLVNVSNTNVNDSEIQITAAGAQSAIMDDTTYVVEQTVGSAGALTIGGTATITDFTNLTQVAAYLSERFTAGGNEKAMIFLNNGVNTYAYYVEDSGGTTIAATEINLVGVFIGAVLNAGDIYQS